jgi:hypothetical protein
MQLMQAAFMHVVVMVAAMHDGLMALFTNVTAM